MAGVIGGLTYIERFERIRFNSWYYGDLGKKEYSLV